jgi:uncharacterized OB-fold protein
MEFPMPTEDSVNKPMLTGWRERGELVLQHCPDCGAVTYYPRKICPSCWSRKLESRPSSGGGRIISFSIVHRGVDEAFRQQGKLVTLAAVQTDDGPQVITRIIVEDTSQVKIGGRVRLYAGSDRAQFPLPVYALATDDA